MPSTPCPALTVFICGGSLTEDTLLERPFIGGPLTAPYPALWLPGTTFISAIIEPGRFASLFDIDLDELTNAVLPLDELRIPSAQLEETLRASDDPQAWVRAFADWLLKLLARREGGAVPFVLPAGLLSLPTGDIATRCGISVRSLERRFLASYGQSIRDARKMERYVRALGKMMAQPARHGLLTRVAMDAGYHDQAHMIRDFIQYTGRAPRSLMQGLAGDQQGELRLLHYDDADVPIVAGDLSHPYNS
ncbi:helix-turn-helix domain-containing protein [Pseudoduganella sp. UC29_106]|uniref:helix-turn-helix domain-containing protein n=1 Tax=Pseudoduganella sp. UC29_106 TaxID=3374553 RepID=UPI003757D054